MKKVIKKDDDGYTICQKCGIRIKIESDIKNMKIKKCSRCEPVLNFPGEKKVYKK